jgi:glycosyl hydrolase family 113
MAGLLGGAVGLLAFGAAPPQQAATPVPRRIEIRAAPSLFSSEDRERMAGWSARQGVQLDIAAEGAPVTGGARVFRAALSPASPDLSRRLARFGVTPEAGGFSFDGRSYAGKEDGVAVRDPAAPLEVLVLANGREAAQRLILRRLFRDRDESDYQVVSGELGKSGRFAPAGERLAIDRKSDRDEIGTRDAFLRSLTTVERAGARWRFARTEQAAVERLERLLHPPDHGQPRAVELLVTVFPDAATKARITGSSRPADLSREGRELRLDVDASAPAASSEIPAAFASAAYASAEPRLLDRPVLLCALGARSAGTWWGRPVRGFASFAAKAGVAVSPEETIGSWEDVSPVLGVGSAASWIDAGIRLNGEAAVLRALAGPEGPLRDALRRWQVAAVREPAPAPVSRRPLPPGFLRGVSYAMSNSIEASYASPRSRETLRKLAQLGANSVSIMPFAWSSNAETPAISYVHRRPQGETDECTVRAVTDARAAGMTALVKPQIWVGGEVFVGRIAMRSEADWKKWFANYRRFLVHHAVVSEAAGAAMFCVGTELVATEGRAADWRETIAAVRLATGAPLTYAANWVGGAMRVTFWDALDAIGVDFYDPLAPDAEATDAALEAGARAAARPLGDLSRRLDKPVVFTEAGYPLARAAWLAPHDENSGRPAAPSDAARAIAAVYRALDKEPWWRGVYWWKAFSSGREARPDERGFNVLGGPAERAMSEGFSRLRERGGAVGSR